MSSWWLVAVGSACGGMLRYGLARLFPTLPDAWPLATMLANLSGCFAIGVVAALIALRAPETGEGLRLFWMTGVLGGFTTWSAFALESTLLLGGGQALRGGLYLLVTVIGCIAAAFAGRAAVALLKG